MADTEWSYPGASTYRALVPDYWDKQLDKKVTDSFDLKGFIGKEKSRAPIVEKTQLGKDPGDKLTIGMMGILDNVPYFGDRTLEATGEEALLFYDQQVYINQLRAAVRDTGAMTRKRDPYNLMERAVEALGDWYGRELSREAFFTWYYGWSPNVLAPVATYYGLGINSSVGKPARYWYTADELGVGITYSATDATYRTNIAAAENSLIDDPADRMCPAIIEGLATKARVANMPQAVVAGNSGLVLFLHPNQVNQLRRHKDWFEAMQNAMPRSKDNPIFNYTSESATFLGKWAGILIFESNFVASGAANQRYGYAIGDSTNYEIESTENVRRALLVGASSMALAKADGPAIEKKDTTDYNNVHGRAVRGILGMARADYTSDDGNSTIVSQGVIVVSTYSPSTVLKGD